MRVVATLRSAALAVVVLAASGYPGHARADAQSGKRLFPATLTFDDPGIDPELSSDFLRMRDRGADRSVLVTSLELPLTPRFALDVEARYLGLGGPGMPTVHGWDNPEVSAVWQSTIHPESESITAFSLSRTPGFAGSRAVREPRGSWSAGFAFGKGLPHAGPAWLRGLAFTGAFELEVPDDPREPRSLEWGFSAQYSLPYLRDVVRVPGIPDALRHFVPIVELPMETCLGSRCEARTRGYVAPGVMWVGSGWQWGIEVLLPINRATGTRPGLAFGLELHLNELGGGHDDDG